MSDIAIVKAMEQRQRWRSLSPLIPMDMLVPDAKVLLGWYTVYYNAYPDKNEVDHDLLLSLIKTKSQLTPEQWAVIKQAVTRLKHFNDPDAIQGIVNSLLERDFEGRCGAILSAYAAGQEVDLVYEVNRLTEQAKRHITNSTAADYIDDDISVLLSEEGQDYGLKLPTQLLKSSIKGLLGGALICMAARPDKGKSSWLAACLTEFAPQLDKYFSPERPMLWLNNEGSGRRIPTRVYQAALNVDSHKLKEYSDDGSIHKRYLDVVGRKDRIKVKDMHGATMAQIEQVVEAMNPCVVVFDMVANFRMGTGVAGGNKTDDIEAKWQAIREMAVLHDFVAIGTIQVSNEGGNMLYPPYSALKDSKTGVQGAADVILMLGALDSPDMQSIRGLSTPKNKFALPGSPSYVQGDVVFNAATCQFTDGG